ncbi:hypothetical protein BC940DRAFT_162935 [Gongronella butleri]|nr:hypothetical protein BC940DRAFT_162935 [Gongronella butleri]
MAESFSPVGDLAKDAFAGIVTSLCFLNETTLLAGHGPWLKVYDISTNELLFSKEVLPNNRIHRIVLRKWP